MCGRYELSVSFCVFSLNPFVDKYDPGTLDLADYDQYYADLDKVRFCMCVFSLLFSCYFAAVRWGI